MERGSRQAKIAPLFLFMSALFWSLAGVFTKTLPWDGVSLAAIRGTVAFFVCLAVLGHINIKITKGKLIIAVCYFTQGLLYIMANKLTTAANATVLENMSPLYIILLNAVLMHTRPSRLEIATCCFLMLGVSLAFAGNMAGGGALGNVLALISALFYAGVFFFSKYTGADSLESLVLGNLLYLLILPYCLVSPSVYGTSPQQWAVTLVFAFLTGAVAWLCFSKGISNTSAIQANFITMMEPIMAPIWTFIFLKEQISPMSFVGCGVVIITLITYNILVTRAARRGEPTA